MKFVKFIIFLVLSIYLVRSFKLNLSKVETESQYERVETEIKSEKVETKTQSETNKSSNTNVSFSPKFAPGFYATDIYIPFLLMKYSQLNPFYVEVGGSKSMVISDKNVIIVATRGTFNSENKKQNLKSEPFSPKDFNLQGCSGMKSHTGYNEVINTNLKGIWAQVVKLTNEKKPQNIVFTGHSAGGALSNHFVVEYLRRKSEKVEGYNIPNVHLVTYGAPPSGNKNFTECISKNIMINARVIVEGDHIPNSYKARNYVHHGNQFWYVKTGNNWVLTKKTVDDYKTDKPRDDLHKLYLDHKVIDLQKEWKTISLI